MFHSFSFGITWCCFHEACKRFHGIFNLHSVTAWGIRELMFCADFSFCHIVMPIFSLRHYKTTSRESQAGHRHLKKSSLSFFTVIIAHWKCTPPKTWQSNLLLIQYDFGCLYHFIATLFTFLMAETTIAFLYSNIFSQAQIFKLTLSYTFSNSLLFHITEVSLLFSS